MKQKICFTGSLVRGSLVSGALQDEGHHVDSGLRGEGDANQCIHVVRSAARPGLTSRRRRTHLWYGGARPKLGRLTVRWCFGAARSFPLLSERFVDTRGVTHIMLHHGLQAC